MRWIPASRGERVAFLTLLGVVVLLAVVPIGRLAQEALAPGGKVDPALLAGVLENPAVWRAARNTLTVSLVAMTIALVLGMLGSFGRLNPRRAVRGPSIVLIELFPHSEEWVRARLGHRSLGIDPADVKSWLRTAGFSSIMFDDSIPRGSGAFRAAATRYRCPDTSFA